MTSAESSQTCLFCIPLRKGVLFLNFVGFASSTFTAVWGWSNVVRLILERPVRNSSNESIVALYNSLIVPVAISSAIYSVTSLFLLWGGWAAFKRRASHFKVFALIYAILTVVALILLIWNASVVNIVTSVLGIYWTFVYYTYWKVITDTDAARSDGEGGKEVA